MPEIKNNFLQGKMNKDLDERLLPNGQYRDALNVEVSTSESSNVGVVKNIIGNHRLEDLIPSGYRCVGSVTDEKSNKLYWFISSYGVDAIMEYNLEGKKTSFVFVDLHAGTSEAVLKFSGGIITGINIIGGLLLWTDNFNEPRKINIEECKKGTTDLNNHTQLTFKYGGFNGLTIDIITDSTEDPFVILEEGERVWYDSKQLDAMLGTDAVPFGFTSREHTVKHYRGTEYLGVKNIVVFNDLSSSGIGTYLHAVDNFTDLNIDSNAWEKGDVIFGNDVTIDIEERHITVIKQKPLNAPSVKINHTEDTNSTSNIPNLFETKLPRFSYRYKYRDGEYSAFAPFTTPVFNAKYPKDTSVSFDTNVFYNQDNAYDIKEPSNKAMVNSIHSVELTDFITAQTPEDVIEVDILYKQEQSNVIYSIGTIKHIDSRWHTSSNYEGLGIDLGLGKSSEINTGTYEAIGSLTKGNYIVTTENIYAALPENQLLRPWDNVPKKAQAQEVTGNRVVYGNYLQGYDIEEDVEILVNYNDRQNNLGTFDTQGLPHIKSQRNYQLGVVYCDKHGRETPVFTSTDGAVNIPWQDSGGNKNASRSLQLNSSVTNNFPSWVDSLKFFVKENSNPYYNLAMERAWVTKSTYELDDSEGHLYISFPSSDRNKITEEDYIILKKKIGTGEQQISTENKYKVIDIKNEAPEALKYQLVNLGAKANDTNNVLAFEGSTKDNSLFYKPEFRPDKETNKLIISEDCWKLNDSGTVNSVDTAGSDYRASLVDNETEDGDALNVSGLYVSWRRVGVDNSASKKYRVVGGFKVGDTNGAYVLNLENEITSIDADIAHINGDSSTIKDNLHPDLVFQVEKRELRNEENFDGKFFVKISKNQVTDLIQSGNPVSITDQYQVTAKTSSWYWQDDVASGTPSISVPGVGGTPSNYGLLNWNGFDTSPTGTDSIHDAANNVVGDEQVNSEELRVTDYHEPWEGIQEKFGSTFFIDSMHMAAGQSDASDYAKYSCITWAGLGGEPGLVDHVATSTTESAWSYPPLKTWITEFEDISGLRDKLKANSVWFDGDLISTSLLVPKATGFYEKRIDGFVGPLQKVDRYTHDEDPLNAPNIETPLPDHINGLEGFVTTTETHATGPRRWFSGIKTSSTEHGVGSDTKTYSSDGEVGRHFMHLSFFAPGKDLHDGEFDGFDPASKQAIYGEDSWSAQLQGIWGGGVFTGESNTQKFGTTGSSSTKHLHLPMETNHNSSNAFQSKAPGPGVGHGYNEEYKELHERQWDPTFNDDELVDNKIRDFIRNLYPGSQFRFNKVTSVNVTDTVNMTTATVAAGGDITLDTNFSTTGIKVGDVVTAENPTGTTSIPTGTTITATNVGSDEKVITLSEQITIEDDETLTFSSPGATDTEVYTIKKVAIKKLYNHTSWRKPYNRHIENKGYIHNNDQDLAYHSVEQTALSWLDSTNEDGKATGNTATTATEGFKNKIVQFGAANNRRICYIIELDKNPTDSTSAFGNPLAAIDVMTADYASNNFCDIEFLDPVQDILLSDLNKFPAIWETDPRKSDVDLDIYFEASNNIPVKINGKTNELFAPVGCTVEVLNSTITSSSIVQSWDGFTATLHPGLVKYDVDATGVQTEIDYSDLSFKFIREDGSYTIAEADTQISDPLEDEYKAKFIFKENIGDVLTVGLSWYNSFSFGNGIESNRIRDDFNEIFIVNGVKASTTTQETYEEERRATSLIYSGIYNSNSSVNDLNQFIMAEKITKDLNPTFGSIQKLFQRRISLIAFCEDKVVSITANKDTIFNADGNPQLVASNKVLGDANPFSGEYGISKNPESFAAESYRTYFTDKQRGAVLRLSKDGLTPISKAGMHDWFRDNLTEYNSLIGTYDSYKEDYNLTLSNNNFSINLLQDAYLEESGDPILNLDVTNRIQNPGVSNGVPFQYLYETNDVLNINDPLNPFNWDDFLARSYDLTSSTYIVHHAAIGVGDLQSQVDEVFITNPIQEQPVFFGGGTQSGFNSDLASSGGFSGQMISMDIFSNSILADDGDLATEEKIKQQQTQFNNTTDASGVTTSIELDNNINSSLDIAYSSAGSWLGSQFNGDGIGQRWHLSDVNDTFYNHSAAGVQYQVRILPDGSDMGADANTIPLEWRSTNFKDIISGKVEWDIPVVLPGGGLGGNLNKPGLFWNRVPTGQCYGGDYEANGNTWGYIGGSNNYVTGLTGYSLEFLDLGINNTGDLAGTYLADAGSVLDSTPGAVDNTTEVTHSSCFAGEEIHVRLQLGIYLTRALPAANLGGGTDGARGETDNARAKYGCNFIQPEIEFFDGDTGSAVDPNLIVDTTVNITTPDGNTLYEDLDGNVSWSSGIPTVAEMDNGDVYADWDDDLTIRASTADDITPFNCLHSDPYTGEDGDSGFESMSFPQSGGGSGGNMHGIGNNWDTSTSANSSYIPGMTFEEVYPTMDGTPHNVPFDYWDSFGWQKENGNPGSNLVTFSATSGVYPDDFVLNVGHGNISYGILSNPVSNRFWNMGVGGFEAQGSPDSRLFTISCSIKLKDSVSTNEGADRNYDINTPATKVIGDLRVRLKNDYSAQSHHWGVPSPNLTWWRLTKPLFRIDTVEVRKGFGVIESNHLGVQGVWQTYPVNPVPPVSIPAWTQVQHNHFTVPTPTWNIVTDALETGNTTNLQVDEVGYFGDNYPAQTITGASENSDESLPPNNDINYVIPSGFNITTGTENPPANIGTGTAGYGANFAATIGASAPPVLDINSDAFVEYNNGYIQVQNVNGGASDIVHSIVNNAWTEGEWYLVDVEFEDFDPANDPGELLVYGVANGSGIDGNEINVDGVGVYASSNGVSCCKLIPTIRNEYGGAAGAGDNKEVLRGIFQITSSSWVLNNDTDNFTLRVSNCTNGIKINKIVTKKLNVTAGPGDATNWDSVSFTNIHSFSDNSTYFRDSKLCFEVPLNQAALYSVWSQDLVNLSSFNEGNWDLSFTVSNNPITNGFSGSLGGIITVGDGSVFRGVSFSGIQEIGDYRISFNLNNLQDASDWKIYKDDIEYNAADIATAVGNLAGWDVTNSDTNNKIKFYNDVPGIFDQEYAVGNISLTPIQQLILVGDIGVWSINGFDVTMSDPYVYLDNTNNYFVFDDCPVHETGETQFINISQQVTAFANTNIPNEFDQYKISFSHGITTGEVAVYYYNSQNYGFKITEINSSTPTNFEQVISIGQDTWSGIQEDQNGNDYSNFDPDYKNTFVIVARDTDENINGYIDNIFMVKVYTDNPDKTVTFNESVNGWSSFKSFIPENGVSLSKKYFTLKEGGLYQHYVPKLNGSLGITDSNGFFIKYTPEEANNYNVFYGENSYSSIKAVLNEEPSSVKMFNTLNYEGSQAYIVKPGQNEITINNAAAWSANSNILGWECSEIKTNLDAGSIIEFIEKEGKWFNYIKGINANQLLDTSRFSVQGIGMVKNTASVNAGAKVGSGGSGASGGTTGGGTTGGGTAGGGTTGGGGTGGGGTTGGGGGY